MQQEVMQQVKDLEQGLDKLLEVMLVLVDRELELGQLRLVMVKQQAVDKGQEVVRHLVTMVQQAQVDKGQELAKLRLVMEVKLLVAVQVQEVGRLVEINHRLKDLGRVQVALKQVDQVQLDQELVLDKALHKEETHLHQDKERAKEMLVLQITKQYPANHKLLAILI